MQNMRHERIGMKDVEITPHEGAGNCTMRGVKSASFDLRDIVTPRRKQSDFKPVQNIDSSGSQAV
jgi:hypothetical protein